jgi:DtxR family Mn-dependent transcriptional regulator
MPDNSRSHKDRKVRITSSMEDYLETILELTEGHPEGEVRVTDIARKLHVSRPSVVGMLRHLDEHHLAVHDRYGLVRLTSAGLKVAREMLHRHRVLRRFLEEVLGLDAAVAEEDACRMEHTLSPETIARFVSLQEFRQESPLMDDLRAEAFRKFLRHRRRK